MSKSLKELNKWITDFKSGKLRIYASDIKKLKLLHEKTITEIRREAVELAVCYITKDENPTRYLKTEVEAILEQLDKKKIDNGGDDE